MPAWGTWDSRGAKCLGHQPPALPSTLPLIPPTPCYNSDRRQEAGLKSSSLHHSFLMLTLLSFFLFFIGMMQFPCSPTQISEVLSHQGEGRDSREGSKVGGWGAG